eukprot:scaffold1489_cov194-Cylindrotheca_fusiformis.AAC.9
MEKWNLNALFERESNRIACFQVTFGRLCVLAPYVRKKIDGWRKLMADGNQPTEWLWLRRRYF